MVISSTAAPVKVATTFRADFSVIDAKNIIANGEPGNPFRVGEADVLGYQAVLHAHTVSEEVTLVVSVTSYH